VQLGILFDSLRHWQKRVMMATWNRVRQYWTQEQWIRVTDTEGAAKFVGLNMPTQPGMAYTPVAQLDVDIVIDEAPDVITLQSEQWMQLTELASKGVPIPPDVLLQASTLRNKKELIDRMTNGGQVPPEVQQMLQQKEAEFAEAAQLIQQKEQEVSAKEAEVNSAESGIKAEIAMLNARKIEISALEKVLGAHADAAQAKVDTARVAEATTADAANFLPALAEMFTANAQAQAQQSEQIAQAMVAVAQALSAPKLVELNKGADGRPTTATVTPMVQ